MLFETVIKRILTGMGKVLDLSGDISKAEKLSDISSPNIDKYFVYVGNDIKKSFKIYFNNELNKNEIDDLKNYFEKSLPTNNENNENQMELTFDERN